jgi:hypothetical protein
MNRAMWGCVAILGSAITGLSGYALLSGYDVFDLDRAHNVQFMTALAIVGVCTLTLGVQGIVRRSRSELAESLS